MVRIITDSTSDISRKSAAEMNITVVPLTVTFGGASYRDGIDMTIDEFYEKLAAADKLPHTSQVNPDVFEDLFRKTVDQGDEIVGIFISAEMSGTCQSAMIARDHVGSDKIHVVDSRITTIALAVLVRTAVRLRDEGKSAEEIAAILTALTKRVRLLAVVSTLKYLKMGGRISGATAFVGGILGISPVVTVKDGHVESVGKVRGRKAGLHHMLDLIRREPIDPDYPVAFGHSKAPDGLAECVSFFRRQFEIPQYFTSGIGMTVGTHVGPGAIGIAYIAKAPA
jgi:DegV family protein with EDD domain